MAGGGSGGGDRTERPTAKRLRDARKKGQIPRSKNLGETAGLAGAVVALTWAGGAMVRDLMVMLVHSLDTFGNTPLQTIEISQLTAIAMHGAEQIVLIIAPIALATSVGVLLTNTLQGGWVFSTEALQFQWGNLSPVNGLKKLGLTAGVAETVKGILLVVALSAVSWRVVFVLVEDAERMGRMPMLPSMMLGWAQAMSLLKRAVLAMGLIAAADYGLQRYRFTQQMKMTKQEVRDDMKQVEGNPEIKGRIRRIQRDMARRRMLQATKKATVVITNPTHYAIALEYRRDVMPAPRVVAKGQDLMAARIREIAREHGVPIVENKPLAQALYRSAEIGDLVPGDLFEAVAEVLAYLIRLKQLVL